MDSPPALVRVAVRTSLAPASSVDSSNSGSISRTGGASPTPCSVVRNSGVSGSLPERVSEPWNDPAALGANRMGSSSVLPAGTVRSVQGMLNSEPSSCSCRVRSRLPRFSTSKGISRSSPLRTMPKSIWPKGPR